MGAWCSMHLGFSVVWGFQSGPWRRGGRCRSRRRGRLLPVLRVLATGPTRMFAVLSATTFWTFVREFSPLEVCAV